MADIFCSSCRHTAPEEGGNWKLMNGGKKRFVCAGCVAVMKVNVKKDKAKSKAGRKPDPRKDSSDFHIQVSEQDDKDYLRQIGF